MILMSILNITGKYSHKKLMFDFPLELPYLPKIFGQISSYLTFSKIDYPIDPQFLGWHAWANSVDPDQTPQNIVSDQGSPCFPSTSTNL